MRQTLPDRELPTSDSNNEHPASHFDRLRGGEYRCRVRGWPAGEVNAIMPDIGDDPNTSLKTPLKAAVKEKWQQWYESNPKKAGGRRKSYRMSEDTLTASTSTCPKG